MKFITIFENKTSFEIVERYCKKLVGKANEKNPDMDLYRSLKLAPDGKYEHVSTDPKEVWSRYSHITYQEDRVSGGKFIECTERKGFEEHDSIAKGKYICTFKNDTEVGYFFKSEYAGNFEILPLRGIEMKFNLSCLNPFAKFLEVLIRYERRLDQRTGRLRPRQVVATGTKLRSKNELSTLEEDKELTCKKHNLVEVSFDSKEGLGVL